jgi:RNA polymerase sigma-70 factor (ECF subfamily)
MCYEARVTPLDPAETARLVARVIAREPDAVRELVKAVGPVVHGRVAKALMRRRSTRDQRRDVAQEVDDLSQEVFLALFDDDARALRAWDPARGPLGAFVALIADHQVFSIFRSGKRRPWSDDIDVLADPEAIDSAAKSPEARVATKEALDNLLDRLRAELTPKGFELFTRLYVEEQSVETVCADLGMTVDAIYAWRSRLAKVVRGIAARDSGGEEMSDLAGKVRTSSAAGQSP